MNTFLQLELILYPATVAVAALTRQGALRLLQVEDLMEGSLLGAVRAARLLLPVDPAWDGGEAAPGNHRLDLCGGGQDEVKMARRRGGKKNMQVERAESRWCDDEGRRKQKDL